MALFTRSSVARNAGIIPALRRASGSSSAAAASASPRPLAYHSPQAGYSNGGGGASQKQRSEFMDQIWAMMREDKMFLFGVFAVMGRSGYGIYSECVASAELIKADALREKAFNEAVAAAREEARVKGTWV